jgi:hypothetical protein
VLRTLLSLRGEQDTIVSPDGHYAGPPDMEKRIVYVIQTEQGQDSLTPEELAKKYGWKNDPTKVQAGSNTPETKQ